MNDTYSQLWSETIRDGTKVEFLKARNLKVDTLYFSRWKMISSLSRVDIVSWSKRTNGREPYTLASSSRE